MAKRLQRKEWADPEHPTCFISYAWEADEHRDWVRRLAAGLQEGGVLTFLDQWQVHPGMDIVRYMESSIRDSDYVLLVCTPTFAKKANSGKGGVGYEKIIVTGEVFQGVGSDKKFVPILRRGKAINALPSYLRSKVFLDFRDDAAFDKELEKLLRHILNKPLHIPPPLGPRPSLPPIQSSKQQPKRLRKTGRKTTMLKSASPKTTGGLALKKKSGYDVNVFINCPFDAKYSELFKVLIFTVTICGFRPRSTLEYGGAGQTRIHKIFTVISECKFGIHDISRTELDKSKLPRLNMPLELGMFLGAQRFDPVGKRQRNCLILDEAPYRYQKFISDLAGLDIQSHNGDPATALQIVRDWLKGVSGRSLPSANLLWNEFKVFRKELPAITKNADLMGDELSYKDFAWLIARYLDQRFKTVV
jgi:hypothetical protein